MRIKTYQEFLNEHNSEDLKANEEFSVDLESGDVLGKEGEVKFYHVDAENEERDCTLQAMLDTAAKLVDKDVTPRGLWGDVEDKNTFSLSYEFTTPDKELEDTTEGGHGYILKINFPKKKLEELLQKVEKKEIKGEEAVETLNSWIDPAMKDLKTVKGKSGDVVKTGFNEENGTEVIFRDLEAIQRNYLEDVKNLMSNSTTDASAKNARTEA